jgi:hypothetical protein
MHYSEMRPGSHVKNWSATVREISRARRLAFVLVAAMQLVLPPALTVADGYLEAAAPEGAAYAHIESHGSSKCPRVHQEDGCAINHFLSRAGTIKPSGAVSPQILARISAFLPEVFAAPALASALTPSLPRAPPIA